MLPIVRGTLILAAVVVTSWTSRPGDVPRAPLVSFHGDIFDSLANAPLAYAELHLLQEDPPPDSAPRAYYGMSERDGLFVFDSVVPGVYRLAVFHPRLDSLGLTLAARQLAIDDRVATLHLAVPTRATLAARYCPASDSLQPSNVFAGVVRDARDGRPIPGATVLVRWGEISLEENGLAARPATHPVRTGANGSFVVCDPPGEIDLEARAAAGDDTTSVIVFRLPRYGILARDLFLGRGAHASLAPVRLSGHVVTPEGEAIRGAQVALAGSERVTTTDAAGRFVLDRVTPGTMSLVVTAPKFPVVRQAIDVPADPADAVATTIVLRPPPLGAGTLLAPVRIVARADEVLRAVGFNERRRSSSGRFIDNAFFERTHVPAVTSAIAMFPGTLTRTAGARGNRLFLVNFKGEVCAPVVWIDGQPTYPYSDFDNVVDIDRLVQPDEVAGVEIYRRASEAPIQYGGTSRDGCGAVVIWRRSSRNLHPDGVR